MVNARRGKDQLGTKSQIPIDFARGAPGGGEFGGWEIHSSFTSRLTHETELGDSLT
jgi:hypothetical protein